MQLERKKKVSSFFSAVAAGAGPLSTEIDHIALKFNGQNNVLLRGLGVDPQAEITLRKLLAFKDFKDQIGFPPEMTARVDRDETLSNRLHLLFNTTT